MEQEKWERREKKVRAKKEKPRSERKGIVLLQQSIWNRLTGRSKRK